jgi:hypothetical protein
MAAVSDGTNPGRAGKPERQMPGTKYHGRPETGLDPTMERGQVPADIFGIAQSYSTGARGSSGGTEPTDVTTMPGQVDKGLAQVFGAQITSTGAPGTEGARNSMGGEHITYTDPFGYLGQEHRESSTSGRVSGTGDWTQANDMGYDSGPTLPSLVNARPTSSGAGQGRVRGAGKGL